MDKSRLHEMPQSPFVCLKGLAAQLGVASHADVLSGSVRVPGAGTRDEPLRTSAWEAKLGGTGAESV